MELVMPEVFFWTTDRDPDTGVASTHIVDGQQRINAIVDYIGGEFVLGEKYLMSNQIKSPVEIKILRNWNKSTKTKYGNIIFQ